MGQNLTYGNVLEMKKEEGNSYDRFDVQEGLDDEIDKTLNPKRLSRIFVY